MEDFWDNYSEYDAMAEEMKASLINSVKTEVKNKIEKLEKENAELRDKQSNLTRLEADAAAKVQSAERREKEAESRGLRLKATELLESLQKPAYKAEVSFIEKEKCDKCNDKRQLDFIYPSGKPGHEPCVCASRKMQYTVKEAIGTEARITFWGGKRELTIWYKPYNSESDSIISSITEVYKGQPFSEMQGSNYIFYDNAKAQEYANHLTQRLRLNP